MPRTSQKITPKLKARMVEQGLVPQLTVLSDRSGVNLSTLSGNLVGGKPMSLGTALKILAALGMDSSPEFQLLKELDGTKKES